MSTLQNLPGITHFPFAVYAHFIERENLSFASRAYFNELKRQLDAKLITERQACQKLDNILFLQ